MKKILLTFVVMLFTVSVIAATTTGLKTATERENGVALGLSEIEGHKMYCGTVEGDLNAAYSFEKWYPGATLPDTKVIIVDIPVGTYYCHFTTMDIDTRESKISANYITLINEAKALPKPPMVTPEVIRIITTL